MSYLCFHLSKDHFITVILLQPLASYDLIAAAAGVITNIADAPGAITIQVAAAAMLTVHNLL